MSNQRMSNEEWFAKKKLRSNKQNAKRKANRAEESIKRKERLAKQKAKAIWNLKRVSLLSEQKTLQNALQDELMIAMHRINIITRLSEIDEELQNGEEIS